MANHGSTMAASTPRARTTRSARSTDRASTLSPANPERRSDANRATRPLICQILAGVQSNPLRQNMPTGVSPLNDGHPVGEYSSTAGISGGEPSRKLVAFSSLGRENECASESAPGRTQPMPQLDLHPRPTDPTPPVSASTSPPPSRPTSPAWPNSWPPRPTGTCSGRPSSRSATSSTPSGPRPSPAAADLRKKRATTGPVAGVRHAAGRPSSTAGSRSGS